MLTGMLLANGRRTVTTWLRAAGVSDDYKHYYYFLTSVGCNRKKIASQLAILVMTMASIPKWRCWHRFATRLQLAARLVEWLVPILKNAEKAVWVVVDGGDTKVPFLKRVLKLSPFCRKCRSSRIEPSIRANAHWTARRLERSLAHLRRPAARFSCHYWTLFCLASMLAAP